MEEFPSTCMYVWGNGGIIHACTCHYSYASVVHVVVCYPSKGWSYNKKLNLSKFTGIK